MRRAYSARCFLCCCASHWINSRQFGIGTDSVVIVVGATATLKAATIEYWIALRVYTYTFLPLILFSQMRFSEMYITRIHAFAVPADGCDVPMYRQYNFIHNECTMLFCIFTQPVHIKTIYFYQLCCIFGCVKCLLCFPSVPLSYARFHILRSPYIRCNMKTERTTERTARTHTSYYLISDCLMLFIAAYILVDVFITNLILFFSFSSLHSYLHIFERSVIRSRWK